MVAFNQVLAATPGFPRDLTWDDFRNVEEPPLPFAALTASRYDVTNWGITSGTAKGERRGSYFVDPLKVTVRFLSDQSWAQPSAKGNKRLLAHEQGHFDITGLIARDLARRLLELRVYGPELRDANDIRAANRALEQKMRRVLDRVDALWTALQNGGAEDIYDTDTEHGLNESGQREWSAMLKRVRMHHLGLEDTLVSRGFVRLVSDPPNGRPVFGT